MQLQTYSGWEHFVERKRLLQELVECQAAAESALVRSSLCELGRINAQQLEICSGLCRLARPRSRDGRTSSDFDAATRGAPAAGRLERDLKAEIVRLEKEVRYRNQVFSALLARVRRTMDIFRRALTSLEPTYGAKDIAGV